MTIKIICSTYRCSRPATNRALYHTVPAAGLPYSEMRYACDEHATPDRAPIRSVTCFPPSGPPSHRGGTRDKWVELQQSR